MGFFENLTLQIRQVWLGMSRPRRIALVLLTAVSLAAVGGVAYWAAQPDYRVLYSGLSAEDAGAVTAKLQAQSVPFRLGSGGTTILVPAEQVEQLRVDMATEGLPSSGGKGFELFDGNSLAMTPFQQHVNYGRALQSELARTIMHIEPVAFARVHIAQPESSPFIRESKPVTASVVLKLKPGTALTHGAASGIVALVARSVEGLTQEQVTVLDTAGHVLFDQHGSEQGAVPGSQLEYKREYEAYLASKAEEMLGQLLGPGRAVVRVTAEINFKNVTETRESYDLDQKAIKKETIQNHKTPGGGSSPQRGVAGPAGVGKTVGASTGGGNETEETSDTEYYSPPKTIQQRVEGAGNVERLTVAAMVDRQSVQTFALADAEAIIMQAVGYKKGRDEIKVSDVKMPEPPADTESDTYWLETQRLQGYLAIVRAGSLGVVAVVGLVMFWLVLRRVFPTKTAKATNSADQQEQERLAESLSTTAQIDPEVVARVLTTWL